jgi:hypothetical protein
MPRKNKRIKGPKGDPPTPFYYEPQSEPNRYDGYRSALTGANVLLLCVGCSGSGLTTRGSQIRSLPFILAPLTRDAANRKIDSKWHA